MKKILIILFVFLTSSVQATNVTFVNNLKQTVHAATTTKNYEITDFGPVKKNGGIVKVQINEMSGILGMNNLPSDPRMFFYCFPNVVINTKQAKVTVVFSRLENHDVELSCECKPASGCRKINLEGKEFIY